MCVCVEQVITECFICIIHHNGCNLMLPWRLGNSRVQKFYLIKDVDVRNNWRILGMMFGSESNYDIRSKRERHQ